MKLTAIKKTHWKTIKKFNESKKRCLIVTKDADTIKRYCQPNVDVVGEEDFLAMPNYIIYDYIGSWDCLYTGNAQKIYSFLTKMNFILKDSGFIFLVVLKATYHTDQHYFCWNYDRILSFGKTKQLKLVSNLEETNEKGSDYLYFKYAPDI